MFVSVQDVAVLVIDDDYGMRNSLQLLLGDAGYTVYEAPDGMSGLTRLRTLLTPLVVLLDWRMPGMDGLEMLHAVATDVSIAHQHTYILLTASYDDPALINYAFPAGITVSIVGKPVATSHLLRTVAAAADHLAQRRVLAHSTDE
jgi:CheY-like chemotaxis protein